MKREIKFRALLEGKWYYSDSQEDTKALGAKLGGSCMAAFMNRFYGHPALSQYTGLKDRDGREIYEGDILEERYADHLEPEGFGIDRVTVAFQSGAFGWIGSVSGLFFPFADGGEGEIDVLSYRIVGHVFGNAEQQIKQS